MFAKTLTIEFGLYQKELTEAKESGKKQFLIDLENEVANLKKMRDLPADQVYPESYDKQLERFAERHRALIDLIVEVGICERTSKS